MNEKHIKQDNKFELPTMLITFYFLMTATQAAGDITASADWFPTFLDASVVSDNMDVNGINMKVWELRSSKSSAESIRYYVALWQKHRAKIRYQNPQWDVAGYIDNRWIATVQLLPNKLDSFGYLSISRLPDSKPAVSSKFSISLPAASETMTNITSKDGPHSSRTIVFRNSYSIENNALHFLNAYLPQGWVEDETPTDAMTEKVLLLRKASDQLTVTLSRNNTYTEGVAVLVQH
jgi:hypothetical protein